MRKRSAPDSSLATEMGGSNHVGQTRGCFALPRVRVPGCLRRVALVFACAMLCAIFWVALASRIDRVLLENTLRLALGSVAISVPLGTALAWLVCRTDMPGRRAVFVTWLLLLFVPLYLQGVAWEATFSGEASIGRFLPGPGQSAAGRLAAVMAIHAAAMIPWTLLFAWAGFWQVPSALEESAALEGGPIRATLFVTLPHVAPWLGTAACWCFLISSAEMCVSDRFAVRTLAEDIYMRLAMGETPMQAARGVAPGLAVVMLVGIAVLLLVFPRVGFQMRKRGETRPLLGLGKMRWPTAVAAWLLTLLAVGVPVASLVTRAGRDVQRVGDQWQRDWSASKALINVGENVIEMAPAWWWSVIIAGTATSAAVLLALLITFPLRYRERGLQTVAVFSVLLAATPAPAIALALIGLLDQPGVDWLIWLYDRTILAPWLGQTLRALPVTTLLMVYALRTFPREVFDMATLDGARGRRLWWDVFLAARLPVLAAAMLAGFVVTASELPVTLILLPPGIITVPVETASLWHYGIEDRVAGACLFQLVVIAGAVLPLLWLLRRGARPK